jgi:AcrR family transcriptional regulator
VSSKRAVSLVRDSASARRRVGLREAILDAARKLCFAEGVDGVSARKIARQVGCTAPAIYSHYRGIDDVLHHLRMEGHALLARAFDAVDPSLPPLERLRAFGRAYYRFAVDHPRYYEVMFLTRFTGASQRAFVQRELFTLLAVRDLVKEGMRAQVIRNDIDPLVLANAIWSQIHGLASLAISGLLLFTAPGHAEELLDVVLDGIGSGVAARE